MLEQDRALAHEVLFAHRHPLKAAPFHAEIISTFHGDHPKVAIEAFRDGAKSTIAEEGVATLAGFQDFNNCVIVGSTATRASERLEAIKWEIDNNERYIETFGALTGQIWQVSKVVLTNDRCIQTLGVGQSVRGIKHHQYRPDLIVVDDMEDDDSVKTPEACHERLKWLYGTLIPACAKTARIRVLGNRLAADAVISKLADDPAWKSLRYPVCYFDPNTGEEKASWPDLYDMAWIEERRAEYERLGLKETWDREYMCEAVSAFQRPFKAEHYKVFPRVRTWEPTYAIFDPARTSGSKKSSGYGKVVASILPRKVIVWDGYCKPMMPSDLIDDIFATETQYGPIVIGVEENGLEEWLKQPLRQEQLRRKTPLPNLLPMRAPKDKFGFIRAMQPFFDSDPCEIEFAKEIPEARSQLISFPGGRIDFLNAMAYLWKIRPGAPIYDDFSGQNVAEDLEPSLRTRRYLAMNADGNHVTAVLCQYTDRLEILADWAEDGDPGQCVSTILNQAQLEGSGRLRVIVPPKEMDLYANKGLVGAIARIPYESRPGGPCERGKAAIRDLLAKQSRSLPNLLVSGAAKWTLRAFSGGYCREIDARGAQAGQPVENIYRTLMEGLESIAAIMHNDIDEETLEDYGGRTRIGKDGIPYRSLIGDRNVRDTKR